MLRKTPTLKTSELETVLGIETDKKRNFRIISKLCAAKPLNNYSIKSLLFNTMDFLLKNIEFLSEQFSLESS